MTSFREFFNGILKQNPVFIQVLGLCPALAVSTSIDNAIGMGAATIFVLLMANLIVSLIRKQVPKKIRIPIFIVIIASFVTIASLVMQAFFPPIYKSLGIYVPLIVVNCVILGRAEAFASKNSPIKSIMDGLGMGIGFTLALLLISVIREFFGTGALKFFGTTILSTSIEPAMLFILAPGALLVMGLLLALFSQIRKKKYETTCCDVK